VRTAAAIAIGVAAAAASGIAAPNPAGRLPVRTLHAFGTRLVAFAQDGPRIAWVTTDSSECPVKVFERTIATGKQVLLSTAKGDTCFESFLAGGQPEPVLALAGTRALWEIETVSHQEFDISIVTGEPARNDVSPALTAFNGGTDSGVDNSVPAPVAGDAGTLAFIDNGTFTDAPGNGEAYVVHRGRVTQVAGVAKATAIAADGARIAVAVPGRVEMHRGAGPAVATIGTSGPPVRAIALSGPDLAVLAGSRIAVFDLTTRQVVRTLPGTGVAPVLSLSGSALIFRRGRTIELADVSTGGVWRVAVAQTTPVGLSIDGTRIAWGETVHGRGVIHAVELPASLGSNGRKEHG
jgi:hypothetical protein